MLGGVIGARAFYVLFNWNLFSGRSAAEICDIRNGGMSLYGGILGGALLAALYCRIRKVSFQRMADTASMGLLITQIIGVWGNFSTGNLSAAIRTAFLPCRFRRT